MKTVEQMISLRIKYITILLLMMLINRRVNAQEIQSEAVKNPPVNVEVLLSNRGTTFQMLIDKKFSSFPKLGFFAVTNIVGEWDSNQVNDYMTQANLTFDLFKGLKLVGGFHMSSGTGIRPTSGLMYSYGNPDLLIVVYPRVDLSKDSNLEGLVLAEYKPKINDKWRFYSRVQGLYAYTMNIEKHARSYLQVRAGLSYKEFTFGLGSNIDYYGPMKHNENSYGGFLSMLLF